MTDVYSRAKYQPYDALRQRFWRQYLKQYDTDDTGNLSHLELTSMLDSLGSTLSRSTVNSFFTRNSKKPVTDELSYAEAIHCLETELGRPAHERKRLSDNSEDSSFSGTSLPATPNAFGTESTHGLALGQINFSGPPLENLEVETGASPDKPGAPSPYLTEPSQQLLSDAASPRHPERQESYSSDPDADDSSGSNSVPEDGFERVINVKNCPLCHRPRMNSKAEVDIVTHLAVCASTDWAKVDKIVVGNFVTASQAQRKWYTKIISKVSAGDYRLGAVSGSIPATILLLIYL